MLQEFFFFQGDYNRIDSDPFLNISQQNAEVKEPVLNYKIKTDNGIYYPLIRTLKI